MHGLGAIAAGLVLASISMGGPVASALSPRVDMRIGDRDAALGGALLILLASLPRARRNPVEGHVARLPVRAPGARAPGARAGYCVPTVARICPLIIQSFRLTGRSAGYSLTE